MGYKIIHNQDACKHEGTLKFPALKLKCIFPHSKELRLRKSGDNILPWCDCSKQVIWSERGKRQWRWLTIECGLVKVGPRWSHRILGERKFGLINGLKLPETSKVSGDCGPRGNEWAKCWKQGFLLVTNVNRNKRQTDQPWYPQGRQQTSWGKWLLLRTDLPGVCRSFVDGVCCVDLEELGWFRGERAQTDRILRWL